MKVLNSLSILTLSIVLFFPSLSFSQTQRGNPIPNAVGTGSELIFMGEDIRGGKEIWNTIKGHFNNVDIARDWLQKESNYLLDHWSEQEFSKKYLGLDSVEKKLIEEKLRKEYQSTVMDEDGRILLSRDRAEAIKFIKNYYVFLIKEDSQEVGSDPEKMQRLMSYFFWKAWLISSKNPEARYWVSSEDLFTWPLWGAFSFVVIFGLIFILRKLKRGS